MIKVRGNIKLALPTPLIYLLLYCFGLLLLRLFLRGQLLELDEAEQVFWASTWQAGYPSQPPLYSWLQYVLFQVFGTNVFSLALLKYSLIFATLYYYHRICQIICSCTMIATAAVVSWVLIPTISFDLLKDNTHSVLALFLSCLTWYWFTNKKANATQWLWYLGLGIIMGCGLLSKFNYAIFLAFLLISAVTLQDSRAKIMTPYFLFSIGVALIVISPYAHWLMTHSALGFSSLYKIAPPEKNLFHGLFSLIKAIGLFALPVLIITSLFFYPLFSKVACSPSKALLLRYHWIALPSLLMLLPLCGFTYFETRWLIPIFFLLPLLLFSAIPDTKEATKKAKQFIVLCLIIETLVLFSISYRSNYSDHYHQKMSMIADVKQIANDNPLQAIIADSVLTLGNLRLDKKLQELRLLSFSQWYDNPKGLVLVCWLGEDKPGWIDTLLTFYQLKVVHVIQKPGYGFVLSKREARSR